MSYCLLTPYGYLQPDHDIPHHVPHKSFVNTGPSACACNASIQKAQKSLGIDQGTDTGPASPRLLLHHIFANQVTTYKTLPAISSPPPHLTLSIPPLSLSTPPLFLLLGLFSPGDKTHLNGPCGLFLSAN